MEKTLEESMKLSWKKQGSRTPLPTIARLLHPKTRTWIRKKVVMRPARFSRTSCNCIKQHPDFNQATQLTSPPAQFDCTNAGRLGPEKVEKRPSSMAPIYTLTASCGMRRQTERTEALWCTG
ncbi:hypothetical protein RvY_14117-1 [Ramazzottius varieornatus]|uniref:Uncharacterized protein n=1 Tax=Ramazzottius varieornatus TaxID=947166 RepID=A0A1D1VRX8_RAMVA|nr:hypothetical protein RvY_14117-1 [Ramazzottius varieornatus]